MPRRKPQLTKRKKGGHRSTGAEVSAEVAKDLGCQSTAEDSVCHDQFTAVEDGLSEGAHGLSFSSVA